MEKKIRFGIIGCSDIARRKTIPAILNSDQATLHMLGSRSKEKAEQWAIEFNAKFSGSYDDVLENDEIDAVYISLPFGLQSEWVIKAANSKKHIICEKSVTTSFELAQSLLDSCKKNKIKILEAFSFRFHPQHKKIHDLVKNNFSGFNTFEGKFGFLSENKDGFRFKKNLGGSGLNDMGCYVVCASRIIFNQEPERVVAHFTIDPDTGIDIEGNFVLFFPDGKTAFGSYGYNNFYQSTYSVWGKTSLVELTRAYAIKPNIDSTILVHTDNGKDEIKIPWVDQTQIMINEFSQVINAEKSPTFDYEKDLLYQSKVLEALRLSNNENRIVHLDELN
jgi:D-xylose 1-dehydrogenase (NADP+, D-xylono-1,5-lactone-forming)